MSDGPGALDSLTATRTAYDTVADAYADMFAGELAGKPLDRALLACFAELVGRDGRGLPVADLGCGPGHVTAHLHELGLDVFGLDLSGEMVALARRAHPHLRFAEGSITALDGGDGSLGGIVSFYSIIHLPAEHLPAVFAELHRVLAMNGWLLLAFHAGDERLHADEWFGQPISLDGYLFPPDRIADLLAEAGFSRRAQLLRDPEKPVEAPFRRAYLLAVKEPRTR